ncbi:hypothetical protein L615_000300000520 [Nocardioides sp. J9]|uniref:Zn-ribbon domain-containing OB-fold protein n=1 Tax=Nocardioides sp. J9 TaxID=935844 RepID=UPI0011A72883|nr:OB-fold domain-containing protein [Nocardioides sp. J9]TWG98560.1 hypothetical protein L615_000300000520 [Nocardioides sp. J9]
MTLSKPPLQAPVPNRRTATFLAGWNEGTFPLRGCIACGTVNEPEAEQCSACSATKFESIDASGMATLVSWTVPHHRNVGGDVEPTGILALAELDEGPWWWAALLADDADALEVGLRLRLRFDEVPGVGQRVVVLVKDAS